MKNKEQIREYFLSVKKESYENLIDKDISIWLEKISLEQIDIIDKLTPDNIIVKDYDLPFSKLKFINTISSFVYKGRVGRRLDKIVYYKSSAKEIPLAYIQYASPILNSKLTEYLKKVHKIEKISFTQINREVVELSICVPFGPLRQFLTGKLAVFVAMSKELINEWNNLYNADIKILFTTSLYGKSSMYNRVRNLKYLGNTEGYHAIFTQDQINEIKQKYKETFPHRKIKQTAKAEHIIRLYDHLVKHGVRLSFDIKKLKKGVYVCDTFLPLKENIFYWYDRWFVGRRKRLLENQSLSMTSTG